jgi:hypothetical protein
MGDITEAVESYILQQNNCLCVYEHGLSACIVKKYPYANVYSRRKSFKGRNLAIISDRPIPGTCELLFGGKDQPTIVCLYAQFDFGPPHQYNKNRPQYHIADTAKQRELWLGDALKNASQYIPKESKIAAPFKLGAGLAKGNWSVIYKILVDWVYQNNYYITFYQLE